ncbi:MAG: septum formation family protein [Actinomycetota bacterium]|nr:septum formation family protein [Actinomycetota bacterium]
MTPLPSTSGWGLDRRSKVALACVVGFGLLAVGLGVAALRDGGDDQAEPVPPVRTDDTVAADDIAVGDCFEDQQAVGISGIPTVPCDGAHDNEIYHLFDVPSTEADPYPGDDRIAEIVGLECLAPFESYVGVAYRQSVLEIFPISPSREVWEAGDREVICAVYDPAGPVTGTLRGTRR